MQKSIARLLHTEYNSFHFNIYFARIIEQKHPNILFDDREKPLYREKFASKHCLHLFS